MLFIRLFLKAWLQIKMWRDVSMQRRNLGKLSDHLLKDIGLSRIDADREASRPFWDLTTSSDPSLRIRGRSNESMVSEELELSCCRQN